MSSERDPRVDPRPGDVLRWIDTDGDWVVCVVSKKTTLTDEHGSWTWDFTPEEWSDWGGTIGGIDGVQVLHRAEVSDG